MTKTAKYIAVLGLVAGSMTSCDDFKLGNAFLEKPLSTEMNIDSVYNQKIYAEEALAQVYHTLPDFLPHDKRLSWGMLEALTDLGDWTQGSGSAYHQGSVTPSSPDGLVYKPAYNTNHGEFSSAYGIRKAYLFTANVDRVPDMTEAEKRIRKGEALAIVAFHNVQSFRYYGGMPWIDHAYDTGEDLHLERTTVEESVKNICGLIDQAADLLPWTVEAADDGRMTKAGMLALKVRFLLFAASPLFNSDQPFMEGEACEKHYTWWGNYDKNRWQAVIDAGKDFMRENQKNGNWYKLIDTGNPRQDFSNSYFTRYTTEALISSHRFTQWNLNSYAISQAKFGRIRPTIHYLDMFQMKDGSTFSWDNPEHKAHPFFDDDHNMVRDPRLYETFTVNDDDFQGRRAEIWKGGRESPTRLGTATRHSRWQNMAEVGVALRKMYKDHFKELQNQFYTCVLLRLPEVYLSIAEAMNEMGIANQKDEFGYNAYDYVNLVRGRVDMPGITPEKYPQGEALREAILLERALEFGYEEVRYFDINRWKHKDYLDIDRKQLNTTRNGDGSFTFEFDKQKVKTKRKWVENWTNRYYLTPIPLEEVNKKYGLVQNPGWE